MWTSPTRDAKRPDRGPAPQNGDFPSTYLLLGAQARPADALDRARRTRRALDRGRHGASTNATTAPSRDSTNPRPRPNTADQVLVWRRSYDIRRRPREIRRALARPRSALQGRRVNCRSPSASRTPWTASSYWHEVIAPRVREGRKVVIAARQFPARAGQILDNLTEDGCSNSTSRPACRWFTWTPTSNPRATITSATRTRCRRDGRRRLEGRPSDAPHEPPTAETGPRGSA